MASGIVISFLPDGGAELLPQVVSGLQATVQNALVNILTPAGTDLLFSNRGTALFKTAISGGIFNPRSAAHAANFAASDTLFFSREYDVADTADQLREISLQPTFTGVDSLNVESGFLSLGGVRMSYPLLVT